MEEFICNLISNQIGYAGNGSESQRAKTDECSEMEPMPAQPSGEAGPQEPAEVRPALSQSQPVSAPAIPASASIRPQPPPVHDAVSHDAIAGNSRAANSILTTDVSEMIAWLNSQRNYDSFAQSQAFSSMGSHSQQFLYESEKSRIPKPYHDLQPKDCANMIGQSIRTIIMHTCDDSFRAECFDKLGVTSSAEAEYEIRRRLNEMLQQHQCPENIVATPSIPTASESMMSMEVEEQEQHPSQ